MLVRCGSHKPAKQWTSAFVYVRLSFTILKWSSPTFYNWWYGEPLLNVLKSEMCIRLIRIICIHLECESTFVNIFNWYQQNAPNTCYAFNWKKETEGTWFSTVGWPIIFLEGFLSFPIRVSIRIINVFIVATEQYSHINWPFCAYSRLVISLVTDCIGLSYRSSNFPIWLRWRKQ